VRKVLRSAAVLPHPPEAVWKVITDYPNFNRTFRYVSKIDVVEQKDNQTRLSAVAHSRLWGDWPFEVTVNHESHPEQGRYVASWDEPSDDLAVNRGSWTLSPAADDRQSTLLVYVLEVEA